MRKNYSISTFVAGNCYSYLISDNGQALLIDPHISLAEKYGKKLDGVKLSLAGIVDTHTHADHISSAAILKKKYDVPLYMSERAVSSIATHRLKNGDTIKLADTPISVIYTPGHTDDSVSLLTQQGDLFTGDVLLINSVGRTDFQNGSPEDMFDSLARLSALPPDTVVRPAHDYKANKTSTIEQQKINNPFLLEKDKPRFCSNARSKKLAKPANMDTIIDVNRSGSAAGFSTVSPKQAFEKLSLPDSILLDVRTAQEISQTSVRLNNVKNVPLQALPTAISSLSSEKSYYVLCRTGHRAALAAMSLIQSGYPHVAAIEGGLNAWDKAGLPVNKIPGPISIERQVRIIAGCLILIGSLLAFVNLWFLIIPLFVGSGLLFAGATDTCTMGLLLMKLPYNKKHLPTEGGTCALDGGTCSLDAGPPADGATCSLDPGPEKGKSCSINGPSCSI